eukprot:CAMPEP_0204900150 /NCGR_PEP_ID=MMETSP1397-20131031/2285_1 /ASSEMBLY_ACC=CAM_ASM_000891 /TAXON_ID=49980 /ORGANISM="Climacostomum Climacostomum virens, Strain Stock W-24" /LENGTH=215 /DNA_ID=CAMNT_0052068231 /DNA_START=405 /DNA_END=1053 /DNA_ORIENTATION=+
MMGAKSGGTDTAIGLSLLFAALMADGFSSYYTERVRKEHHPDGLAIMDYCNYYGLFLVTPVLVVTEWMKPQSCMVYIAEQPDILYDIMTYCFISAIGQLFIFKVISSFGSLTLAIVTTTRKFFAVLISIFLFNHEVTSQQWVCIVLVVFGSSLDFYAKVTDQERKHKLNTKDTLSNSKRRKVCRTPTADVNPSASVCFQASTLNCMGTRRVPEAH